MCNTEMCNKMQTTMCCLLALNSAIVFVSIIYLTAATTKSDAKNVCVIIFTQQLQRSFTDRDNIKIVQVAETNGEY